ncbi:MAG TPA: DUF4331 family protein [Candidatus Binatia bacterium]|nr:DUF4331 family protein [Candidatus Binatia bacterium]
MKRNSIAVGTAAALLAVLAAPQAHASSHRETYATRIDPCIDNTDTYAWVEPGTHDKLYVVFNFLPLHEPGQGNQQIGPCEDVLYEVHIARGTGLLRDAVTYQIKFDTTPAPRVDPSDPSKPLTLMDGRELLDQISGRVQHYTVTKVEHGTRQVIGRDLSLSPANVGPQTDRLAYGIPALDPSCSAFQGYDSGDPTSRTVGCYNEAFSARFIHPLGNNGSEGRVWAGQAADFYYLDEKGIFDVINLAGDPASSFVKINGTRVQVPGARQTPQAENVFTGFNLFSIALELPTPKLTGTGALPAHDGTPGDDTLLAIHVSESRPLIRILSKERYEKDREFGKYVRVGRNALPLFNAGLVGVQDQEKYLRSDPVDDFANFGTYVLNPILVRDVEALGIYKALGVDEVPDSLKFNRLDLLRIVNLDDIPFPGAHHVPLEPGKVGDVLRVDMAIDSSFPNGRPIIGGIDLNHEQADVSDVILTLILSPDPSTVQIGDGVDYSAAQRRTAFPWIPVALQGLTQGHGAPAN